MLFATSVPRRKVVRGRRFRVGVEKKGPNLHGNSPELGMGGNERLP